MYLNKIKSWYPTLILVAVLVMVSLVVTYVIANSGTAFGPMVIVSLIGVTLLAAVLKDYRIGFYVLVLMAIFMFYVERILNSGFPFGTVYDGLALLTFTAVFISGGQKRDWSLFRNPITILYLLVTLYQVMQVVNPSAVSRVAWLVAMRNNTSILLYVACFQMFASLEDLKKFTKFWLALALICAVYGFYQEKIGLTDFEHHWVYDNPDRLALYYIWGKMRKWSFLSDPSAYGLFAAMGVLAFLVLSLGPFKGRFRFLMAFCGFFTLLAMSYSGTRTAFAMVAVGIVFYIIMSLDNRTTMMATVAAVFVGAIIFFGPFYGGTINRIRSTFQPGDDPSMVVRDQKRVRLQQYILTHPIGGGLYTTGQNGLRYSAGHELAQGWDADSGYLLIGLELGPIGLTMFMALFIAVMLKGINNHFAMTDPFLKTMNMVYLVPFFALSVAHYTQDALFTKPMNLIVIAAYAAMAKLPSFERKLYSVDLV